MTDFDFNSVKKDNIKNISKISLFDSICEDLRSLFNIIFSRFSNNTEFIFSKDGNYINVDLSNFNVIYINPMDLNSLLNDYFSSLLSKISNYLKYVRLHNLRLNLSPFIIDKNLYISDIIKKFAYIKNISITDFDIFRNINNPNKVINFFNEVTSKNEKLYCTGSLVVGIPNYRGIYPKIYSKKLIYGSLNNLNNNYLNNKCVLDLISVGEDNGYFFDIYSDEIILDLNCHTNYFYSKGYSILKGLMSFDNSVKNNDAKIMFYGINIKEEIKNKIKNLNLRHHYEFI